MLSVASQQILRLLSEQCDDIGHGIFRRFLRAFKLTRSPGATQVRRIPVSIAVDRVADSGGWPAQAVRIAAAPIRASNSEHHR
jgi:hypothetical protein